MTATLPQRLGNAGNVSNGSNSCITGNASNLGERWVLLYSNAGDTGNTSNAGNRGKVVVLVRHEMLVMLIMLVMLQGG